MPHHTRQMEIILGNIALLVGIMQTCPQSTTTLLDMVQAMIQDGRQVLAEG